MSLSAGDIIITDTGIYAGSFRGEVGGSVYLDSRSNIVVLNSSINTSSLGLAGDIVLLANDIVIFKNIDKVNEVGAFSALNENQLGEAGNIRLID